MSPSLRLLTSAACIGLVVTRAASSGAFSPSASIVVHADVLVAQLSGALVGNGIEDVNHELVGGIATNAVFGESFEEPSGPGGVSGAPGGPARATWAALAPVPALCAFEVVVGDAFNGAQSQAIVASGATASACGVVNRGLGSGGLSIAPGANYSVRLYAKRLSGDASVPLVVTLLDTTTQQVVVSAALAVGASGAPWALYEVTLPVPAAFAGTVCGQDATPVVPCAANSDALCISCSGALAIALPASAAVAGTTVLLDQVSLVAQSGGPGPADGLPDSRRDVVALLSKEGYGGTPGMGVSALRLGGSAILVDGYRWKPSRGPVDLRQPYNGFWYVPPSSRRWAFYEFLALCEAVSSVRVCVVTLNSAETLQDVADFVEYAYGDPSTVWGAQRSADGHAAPYRPFAVEIGNEQDHTDPAFIAQVAAFARALAQAAARLGLPFRITVLLGVTPGTWAPVSILPLASALSGPDFAPLNFLLDHHIGGDNPETDPAIAFTFIASVRDVLANASSSIRGAVLEENGGRHDMQRALGHARNSNRLRCLGDFVQLETAANGLEVAGRNDNGWNQGSVFITQNATYLSPHGMANVVLSHANESAVVAVESAGLAGAPTLDVIAVVDAARAVVTLRAVNIGAASVPASVSLLGCAVAAGGASASVLVLNASSPTGASPGGECASFSWSLQVAPSPPPLPFLSMQQRIFPPLRCLLHQLQALWPSQHRA